MLALIISAIVSGLILTISFPFYSFWPLAAIGIFPFIFMLLKNQEKLAWRSVFLLTFLFSAAWHFSSLWWFGYVTFVGMFALITLLAFLQAMVFAIGWYLIRRNFWAIFVFPVIWLVFETITTYFLTGFPWMSLGYAWHPWLTIIQIVDITGIHGLSFCIITINTALAVALLNYQSKKPLAKIVSPLIYSGLILLIIFTYGKLRLHQLDSDYKPDQKIKVACVQANIPSLMKHDPTQNYRTLEKYAHLSKIAATQDVAVIIWPETAIPSYYYRDLGCYQFMTNLLKTVDLPIMTGLPRIEGKPRTKSCRFFNSATILDPNRPSYHTYNKMHLVLFGECVPFEKYLPFFKLATPIVGSITPGTKSQILTLNNNKLSCKFGPLICFEDVFAYLAIKMAKQDCDILVNFTNDGWFKSSPEAYQHAAIGSFRAVETRRPLIRATNTGVTTIIDHKGQTTAVLAQDGKCTEVSGVLVAEVPYGEHLTTFYMQWGNWILFLASALMLLSLAYCIVYRKKY